MPFFISMSLSWGFWPSVNENHLNCLGYSWKCMDINYFFVSLDPLGPGWCFCSRYSLMNDTVECSLSWKLRPNGPILVLVTRNVWLCANLLPVWTPFLIWYTKELDKFACPRLILCLFSPVCHTGCLHTVSVPIGISIYSVWLMLLLCWLNSLPLKFFNATNTYWVPAVHRHSGRHSEGVR